jgi:hypothetical protein
MDALDLVALLAQPHSHSSIIDLVAQPGQ